LELLALLTWSPAQRQRGIATGYPDGSLLYLRAIAGYHLLTAKAPPQVQEGFGMAERPM